MKPDVDVLWLARRARGGGGGRRGEGGGGEDRADASYCWNAVATCGRKGKEGGKGFCLYSRTGVSGFSSHLVVALVLLLRQLAASAAGRWPLTAAD